ncbi:hypothetical protein CpipJ_CPIJ010771 [Culex quinquefasciatus]|uniref:Uncharacterized protein n=1 Tax=Culex quinquefasciatus TaxID=7176 RepID=B0WV97_CULQU|nr:hypothetical protein CpipJ_CPIJ010771 [Culex quinquefasciatus]|eukprot:XP_001861319.1 hypothetical protein CpipJ_CPIJ010771 [Culex quinquefasciatus]
MMITTIWGEWAGAQHRCMSEMLDADSCTLVLFEGRVWLHHKCKSLNRTNSAARLGRRTGQNQELVTTVCQEESEMR